MKKILKIGLLSFLVITSLSAKTKSLTFDNDALIGKKDAHYTSGMFYTWMKDEDKSIGKSFLSDLKTNNAISFTHLTFTPEDKKQSNVILDDLPYAGYAKVDFLIYKSAKNYFHEFGVNIGMVGPSTKAKQIQTNFHKIIGATKAKGWDNQLSDELMLGLSYNYAYKTDKRKIGTLDFDWTNNVRTDLGNFYSGFLGSTTFRVGNKIPNNFVTSGNFIGGNESDLLNYKSIKEYSWNISYSIFANKVYNYYIIDEAIDLGYNLSSMDYVLGQQILFDFFYDEIQYRFKIKSISITSENDSEYDKNWAGISIVWKL